MTKAQRLMYWIDRIESCDAIDAEDKAKAVKGLRRIGENISASKYFGGLFVWYKKEEGYEFWRQIAMTLET